MAKRHSLEKKLDELNELRTGPISDPAIEKLRKALESKINHVVAKAARIVSEFCIAQLKVDLMHVFVEDKTSKLFPLRLSKK